MGELLSIGWLTQTGLPLLIMLALLVVAVLFITGNPRDRDLEPIIPKRKKPLVQISEVKVRDGKLVRESRAPLTAEERRRAWVQYFEKHYGDKVEVVGTNTKPAAPWESAFARRARAKNAKLEKFIFKKKESHDTKDVLPQTER